jgi:Mannosyltransferase (PIG-V)
MVALVLLLKALIFTFAVQSVITLKRDSGGWKEIWNRWDAVHYLALAKHGYVTKGDERFSIVFYPLYPWFVRAIAFVTCNYLAAVFVASGIASVAAALLLQRLARLDESKAVAWNAVWFLFIFPTSYFLHIGYTESLFLALTLGCVLAARTDRWWLAGALGACACLTRVNGLLLIPVLGVEALSQLWVTRRINWRWLWIAIVPAGFLGYLWLNHHVTGDYFAFSKIMEAHWYKKFTPPWLGISDVYWRLAGDVTEGQHELFYIALGLIFIIWSWVRLRPSYAVWITCNWLLINSTSFILSVPRYTLTLFPIFILLAQACTGRRLPFAIVTAFSLIYLGLYASRFAQGLWAF